MKKSTGISTILDGQIDSVQLIKIGNLLVVMENGKTMFDIEFSYSIDAQHLKRSLTLISQMVDSYNAESANVVSEG